MEPVDIYAAINRERLRQGQLWNRPHSFGFGDCSSRTLKPEVKALVLGEEVGEVNRAVLEKDTANLKVELVQVAAVAVAWLESLD